MPLAVSGYIPLSAQVPKLVTRKKMIELASAAPTTLKNDSRTSAAPAKSTTRATAAYWTHIPE